MTDVASWAAFAPLIALLGALINGFFGRNLKEPAPGIIASLAVGTGFVLSLIAFISLLSRETPSLHVPLWSYLSAGAFDLSLGFVIDSLSITLMLLITGIGLLIHLYSIAYMHHDDGFSRYFSNLNLFVAAMLILVMSDSFLGVFIGWEGVGVCSYLLIGFWYQNHFNADAARKAFIVNRIGDLGFLLAMFLTVKTFGTLNIQAVNAAAAELVFGASVLGVIGLLYLIGAAGKSAQLPLQVWLPDAMAGPTPVSALIHAATMVTAGVYLVARAAPLFSQSPMASGAVAWVGALTALIAAFAAISQTDIKKILAYSTVSQLGYMFVAVGCGAYWVGIFHLFTHAFFKALLFLASGSVIHALKGEQDIRHMGGLGKHMRLTGTTSLIATLAISGIPVFAGFFSKDAILAFVFSNPLIPGSAYILYGILLITAAMTACYMFRWYYLIFAGEERLSKEAKAHVHESPALMTLPLLLLAFFSIFVGWLAVPEFWFKDVAIFHWFSHWIEPSIGVSIKFAHPALLIEWLLLGFSVLAAIIGIAVAYWIYAVQKGLPIRGLAESSLAKFSQSGAGFDALYQALFVKPSEASAESLAVLDHEVVDKGLKGGVAGSIGLLANALRWLQTGYVRTYALAMFIGLTLLSLVVTLIGVLT